MVENKNNIALFIDGDNFPASRFNELLLRLSTKGSVRIKRIYGDFSSSLMNSWKDRSIRCKLNAVQQFSKKSGNSTDMKLIIDAMDILYSNHDISTFCIASSDADYMSLVIRLQEAGKYVIIAGGEQMSCEMKNMADELVIMESQKKEEANSNISSEESNQNNNHLDCCQQENKTIFIPVSQVVKQKPSIKIKDLKKKSKSLEELVREAFGNLAGDNGWCKRIALGLEISRLKKNKDKIIYPNKLNENSRLKNILDALPNMFEKRGKGYNSELKLTN